MDVADRQEAELCVDARIRARSLQSLIEEVDALLKLMAFSIPLSPQRCRLRPSTSGNLAAHRASWSPGAYGMSLSSSSEQVTGWSAGRSSSTRTARVKSRSRGAAKSSNPRQLKSRAMALKRRETRRSLYSGPPPSMSL